jgi:hypothetical protein
VDQNYYEITGQMKYETDKAMLLFDGKKEVWVPKSQIEDTERMEKNMVVITIPEWLAMEKELI